MEVPLGSEWNTRVGFQRGTLPRVVKKVRAVQYCSYCFRVWGPGGGFCCYVYVYVVTGFRWSGVDRLLSLDGHCDRSVGKAVLVVGLCQFGWGDPSISDVMKINLVCSTPPHAASIKHWNENKSKER